jgi:DNA-binding CsgD family transcriptional regulator/tetratricopeptide (TPR) repeat protein
VGFHVPVLVEREHPLARLTALLDEAAGGSGRLVFLGGEAGVGKTSLVGALVGAAAGRLAVRRGECDSITTTAALGPFIEAVPELSEVLEQAADVDRLRLFHRLRSALSAEPTLLVLEDVHWADEATLDLLRFLGRRLAALPLLVVATFRDDEVPGGSPLTGVLGDLATAPGVSRLSLSPLTEGGVRQLLESAGSPLDAAQLHRSTGGNPFYVSEVIASGWLQLPATVRDAVLARTARLSPAAQGVLAASAVLGQRADLPLLLTVSGQSAAAVDECVGSGVLVGDAEGWAFRHELARQAVEQTLTPGTRVRLHVAALSALRTLGGADGSRMAYHAAAAGDRDAVLEYAPGAAARSARLGAHREAAEQYRLALRFADAGHGDRVALLEALSYECYLTDQAQDAWAARRSALELSAEAGDLRAVGTDQRWLSRLSWFLGRNADAEQYGAQSVATLERVDDGHELAMAYSNLALLRMLGGDLAGAIAWGQRALGLARRIHDRDVEIHALNNIGTAMATDDDGIDGRARLAQSLDLALAADAHEHAARAYTNLGSVAVTNYRLADADRTLRAGLAYCDERDLDSWGLYIAAWLARSLAEQGRYAEADACASSILRRPHLSPVTRIPAAVVSGLLAIRRGQDDAGQLAGALAMAAGTGESQRLVPAACGLAEAAWLAGRLDEIEPAVEAAWPAALAHPNRWALGELSWWLAVAGVRRPTPAPVARPFRLLLDGDWKAAAHAWRELGCPLWAARALASSPDLSDGREALELVDRIGAPAVRRAMLRDRHAAGIPVPRGPQAARQANPAGLTARELEVLRLLAQGLSDAELAQRLFLSQKTVGHHVSAVLHKLGEPTRARAVAAAVRRRIVAAE